MSIFKPTIVLDDIFAVTLELLKSINVNALLLDVDNTLAGHNHKEPFTGVKEHLDMLKDNNIKMIVISNNHANRLLPFCSKLNIDFFADAKKPQKEGFIKACIKLHSDINTTAVVGDQIFTDILGANFAKIKSILLKPKSSEPGFSFKLKRVLEKPLRAIYR